MRINTGKIVDALKGIGGGEGEGGAGIGQMAGGGMMARMMASMGIRGISGFAGAAGGIGGGGIGGIGAGIIAQIAPAAAAAVAGLAALSAGLVLAVKAVVKWSMQALNLAERFRESSPAMAQIAAREDVFDMLRNIRVGQALSGTQRGLQEEFRELKDSLAPLTAGYEEFRQLVATALLKIVNLAVDFGVEFAQDLLSMLAQILDAVIPGDQSHWAAKIEKAIKDSKKFDQFGSIPGAKAIRDLEKGFAGF